MTAPTPPEADVQALAETLRVSYLGMPRSDAHRTAARAVLAAGYRPAPEPTDQTREQIAALRSLPTQVTPHVGSCVYPDDACNCRAMEIRVDLAARIDSILAVHVSPETAEERAQVPYIARMQRAEQDVRAWMADGNPEHLFGPLPSVKCQDCNGAGCDGCDVCDMTGRRGRGQCRACIPVGSGELRCPTCDGTGEVTRDNAESMGWTDLEPPRIRQSLDALDESAARTWDEGYITATVDHALGNTKSSLNPYRAGGR